MDFERVLAYLNARAIPGVERIEGQTWSHALRVGDADGTVTVQDDPHQDALTVDVSSSLTPHLDEVARRVRHAFDLDAEPRLIEAHLTPLNVPVGLRVPGTVDPFATTVRIILGQRISVAAATTIAGRLVAQTRESTELGSVPRP